MYNLPAVMKSETVYLVEGEKDADRLNSLGFTATTSPMGAAKWKPQYTEQLRNKDVIIIPDNDKRWRRIRNAYIAKNPLCEVCKLEGRLVSADVVHHIKELSQGGTHDERNLQSLCERHHASEHMKRRYDNRE